MSRIQHLAVNDEGFVFDPTTGESFTVNSTGLFILNKLKEGLTETEIEKQLTETFDEVPEELQRDMSDFLQQLKSMGIV